ncbi:hypothetical protein C1H71_12280 [Iodobacter fluviatilis]|uniref:Uncharacterized protein n=2 Tax=Iodobacter fluviatilis TaxID=537 RepID=A0A7G3GAE0_9NEIS|nr:hypothetical protein C1H71_12280 [Iodobacter fluviatilis]
MATWYEHHERFLTFVQPQKGAKPEGLSRKMAIHCVMLLDNNPLLPSSHALCQVVFRLSAMANKTSTDPSGLSDLRLIDYGKAGFCHISRIFSLNSQLFASKAREICLKPVFPSLRSFKFDRLLAASSDFDVFGDDYGS